MLPKGHPTAQLCVGGRQYLPWFVDLADFFWLPLSTTPGASLAGDDRRLAEEVENRRTTSLFALAILHATEAKLAKSAEARVREISGLLLNGLPNPTNPHVIIRLTYRFKIANYNHTQEYADQFDQRLARYSGQGILSTAAQSSSSRESYLQLVAQQINLLPITFEAGLHVLKSGGSCDAKFIGLSEVVAKAVELNAPAKTYEIFTDMILCAVSEGNDDGEPPILIDSAAKILYHVIKAAQGTDGYSVLVMSRWVRYLVQLVLSGPEHESNEASLKLIEEVVEQVLVLATVEHAREEEPKSPNHDANVAGAGLNEAYPAAELAWLATTLFNLGVDFYASQNEVPGSKWARKAVELAGVLETSKGVDGDGGVLASVLRTKMAELGWNA